jgi:hypothetical protein
MPKPEINHLDSEIDVFCRYLIGRAPDEYVVSRYRRAHRAGALSLGKRGSRFEELQVRIARISPACTRIADAYASIFPGRRLRSKLVLSLAILENSPAHYECVSPPPRSSRVVFLAGACGTALVYGASALSAMVVFLPLRLAYGLFGSDRSSSS